MTRREFLKNFSILVVTVPGIGALFAKFSLSRERRNSSHSLVSVKLKIDDIDGPAPWAG